MHGRTTLADRLRRAVDESGESHCDVGRGAGVAQPVISRFVSGERDLTLRTAEKLAAYFGLELRPVRKGR